MPQWRLCSEKIVVIRHQSAIRLQVNEVWEEPLKK